MLPGANEASLVDSGEDSLALFNPDPTRVFDRHNAGALATFRFPNLNQLAVLGRLHTFLSKPVIDVFDSGLNCPGDADISLPSFFTARLVQLRKS
jgi:hypothetical protein